MTLSVQQAKDRLPELLVAVDAGQTVEIRGENGRTFRLTAVRPRPTLHAKIQKHGVRQET